MRLKDNLISALINILLGVAWAFTLIAALSAFFTHYHDGGIFYALASAIVWTIPGFVSVLLLEYILAGFARLEESKKQTILLEKILKELKDGDNEN